MKYLSKREIRYLEQIPGIDLNLVGEEIGRGAQNIVYAYEVEKVIKIPRAATQRDLLSRYVSPIITQSADEMKQDMELCAKYFPDFMVDAQVKKNPKGAEYCIIQPRIPLRELTKERHATSPELSEELAELTSANKRMLKEQGVYLDVMGWDVDRVSKMKPYISNVAISTMSKRKRNLALVDFGVLRKKKGWSFHAMSHRCLLLVQQSNMRRFHGALPSRFSAT